MVANSPQVEISSRHHSGEAYIHSILYYRPSARYGRAQRLLSEAHI